MGKKIRAKVAPLTEKKKVLPHAKITWRRCHCLNVGAKAFQPPLPPSLPSPSASPFLYQLARSSRNTISDWLITLLPLQRLQPLHFQSTELIFIINPNDDTKSLYFTPLSMQHQSFPRIYLINPPITSAWFNASHRNIVPITLDQITQP